MRNISADLEERIRAEERSARLLEDRLAEKQDHIAMLRKLLAHEKTPKTAFKTTSAGATASNDAPANLADFILQEAKRGPVSKEELRDTADMLGFFSAPGRSAGRITHATVVSLVKANRLKQILNGKTGMEAKYVAAEGPFDDSRTA